MEFHKSFAIPICLAATSSNKLNAQICSCRFLIRKSSFVRDPFLIVEIAVVLAT